MRFPKFPSFRGRPAESIQCVVGVFVGPPNVGKSSLLDRLVYFLRQVPHAHGWPHPVVKAVPKRGPVEHGPLENEQNPTVGFARAQIDTGVPNGPIRVVLVDTAGEKVRDPAVDEKPDQPADEPEAADDAEKLRSLLGKPKVAIFVTLNAAQIDTTAPRPGEELDDVGHTLAHVAEALRLASSRDCQMCLLYTAADEYGLSPEWYGPLVQTRDARAALRAYLAAPSDESWRAFRDRVADPATPDGKTVHRILDRTRAFYDLAREGASAARRLPPLPYLIAASPPRGVPLAPANDGGCLALLRDLYAHLSRTNRPRRTRLAAAAAAVAAGVVVCLTGAAADAERRDLLTFRAAIDRTTLGLVTPDTWVYSGDALKAGKAHDRRPAGKPDLPARQLVARRVHEWAGQIRQLVDGARERTERADSPAARAKSHARLRDDIRSSVAALEAGLDATPRELAALDKATGDPACLRAVANALDAARAAADAADAAATATLAADSTADVARFAKAVRTTPPRLKVPELAAAFTEWAALSARRVAKDSPGGTANVLRRDKDEIDEFVTAAGLAADPYGFAADRLAAAAEFQKPVLIEWASLPRTRAVLEFRTPGNDNYRLILDFHTQTMTTLPVPTEANRSLHITPGLLVVTHVRLGAGLQSELEDTSFGPARGGRNGVWLPAAVAAIRARAEGRPEPALRFDPPKGMTAAGMADFAALLGRLCPADPFAAAAPAGGPKP